MKININKKVIVVICCLLLFVAGFYGFIFWKKNLRGIAPAFFSPKVNIVDELPLSLSNSLTGLPVNFLIQLPKDFRISVYAKDLGAPRVLAFDPAGDLVVSVPKENKVVVLLDLNKDGFAETAQVVAEKLNKPHGLAFRCFTNKDCELYIAETDKVIYGDYMLESKKLVNKKKILDLPTGGRHLTKTLLFKTLAGQDKLLISSGSSCDVCEEKDWQRALVMSVNPDGTDLKPFATGLRNSVFMTIHPSTGEVIATEMGRDFLGDNLPPDEINIVEENKNYGWPFCYGKNIHDSVFDKNTYIQSPCSSKISSYIDLPAHSAPLGLAFVPKTWPKEFKGSLLVAFHGSWNRSEPTGYKISELQFLETGQFLQMKDFAFGWLSKDGKESLGRPVDLLFNEKGDLFVSDDKAGVVYKISYFKN